MNTKLIDAPINIARSWIYNRELIWSLAKRDFVGRYQGSIFGLAWSMFYPLLMLAVYTLVFGVAFKAKWASRPGSLTGFPLILFVGLIVHGMFAECLNRAPAIILNNPNYVKKVVFPVEILSSVAVISALFHFCIGLVLLLIFRLVGGEPLLLGTLAVPVVMAPLILMTLGLSWILASLGVYLRDVAQVMGVLTTVLMFLSPVFYTKESLPPTFRRLLELNPITLPIEQMRAVVLWDEPINWLAWSNSLLIGIAVAWVGFWWFQKMRSGFADVV